MWIITAFQSVSLFTLKSSLATSSGGKSLLVPTPFAVKMALLDVDFRIHGAVAVAAHWPIIRDLEIAMELPEHIVVTNLFAKILKPRRSDGTPPVGVADAGPMQKTIAYREYVYPKGTWQLALGLENPDAVPWLSELLMQINYLGRRGGFIQALDAPQIQDDLSEVFTLLNPESEQQTFTAEGVMQVLDDCGPKMTLEHANIYSDKKITVDKQRILHHIVIPMRLVRSSRSYTHYERIG